MSNEPLVSIGVPVYNDAPWLRNALDHLLAQDYKNLEIILADDCSTDGSREICLEYAQRDVRIRFFENKHNLGAIGNHKFVFDVSTGDYFAWGSGHDYYLPTFASRMLKELDANPSVLQCSPKSQYDYNGTSYVPPDLLDTRNLLSVDRVRALMKFRLAGGSLDIFYGLFHSEYLAKIDLTSDAVSADEVILADVCILGEIMQIDEVMLHKVSTHRHENVRANRESYRAHLDRSRLSKGTLFKEYLPRLYSFVEYMNMVDRSSLSMEEKEYLFNEIKNVAAHYKKNITEEIENFIEYFKVEIPAKKAHPLVRRIQAAQVLNVLDFFFVLGFEHNGVCELRSICLDALGLVGQARVARIEQYRNEGRNVWQIIGKYSHRLLNSLNRRFVQK